MDQEPSDRERSGLIDTATRLGHHVWAERRIFSFLGAWSASPTGPSSPAAVPVFLGEQAARHGWHAELVLERLPQLREVDAEALVVPASERVEAALDASLQLPGAALPASADGLRVVLAGYYRVVLPRLVGSYRALVAASSEAADASLRRWLGFVIADDVDEWVRGDALTRELVGGGAALDAVLDHQADLERSFGACDAFPG